MQDQLRKGRIEDRRTDDTEQMLFGDAFTSHFQRKTDDEKEPLVRAYPPDGH